MSYKKPKKFDYNLIVIGAGSGGLVSSYIAAQLNAKVALIEKHKMGGDCLNTGCVPSKALIKSAKILALSKRATEFGFKSSSIDFEFSDIMARVQSVVQKIEPHDSVERYTQLGVDCLKGEARIIDPFRVQLGDKTLTARAIIVATGARPFVPPIKGIDKINILTSDNLWSLKKLPKNLVVLGSGPIGCELAQCFQRFGSQVTMVEMNQRIMPREDEDVSEAVTKKFKKEGVNILTGFKATEFKVHPDGTQSLIAESQEGEKEIFFDQVLIAVGREANTTGFGLEELGVNLNPNRTIQANDFLQTNFKNIFVCGDVAGPYQFTHTAAHQAYYACVNALFNPLLKFIPPPFNKSFKVDYSVIPWATYTDPEVATVGHTESSAEIEGLAFEVTRYGIDDLDRAITEEEDYGFVKVLTLPGKDKILGATIVAHNASDLITEFISAMKNGYGLNSILSTIHIYPTMSEANKYLAGNWKRKNKPKNILKLLKLFFSWRR